MAQDKFGGKHTKIKLDAVQKYLSAYTIALSKQNFELIYFDAFAGTGSIDFGEKGRRDDKQLQFLQDDFVYANVEEVGEFSDGSARRALQIPRKFDKYIFVEKNRNKVQLLQELKIEFQSMASRIHVRHGDANIELIEFCENTDWSKSRSVVFLDPFGSQVHYDTIIRIAQTQAIDLWYLFPSGLSVFRQISREGKTTPEQKDSIDRILGSSNWKTEWITTEPQFDLLVDERIIGKKQVEVDDISRFIINRMKRDFGGRVLDKWLPLGQGGAHWYSLMFAWANPSPRARLAAKLAQHVMTRK